jgi:hypothetical protein
MRILFVSGVMASGLTLGSSVLAQPATFSPRRIENPTTFVGADLVYAQPNGDFANYVNQAWGATGHLVHALDARGILAFRAELGYLNYGSRTARQPLGGGALGLINVDVTTSNNIVIGGLGAQLMAPTGVFRPYLAGTFGFSYFFTESSVAGSEGGGSAAGNFASSQNFSDGGFSTTIGGGLYVPISASFGPVSLDLGAQFHRNSDIQYLTKNSITFTTSNAPPMIRPVRSAADYVSFRLGFSVAVH